MRAAGGFRWDQLSLRLAIAAWAMTAILFHSAWSFPYTPIAISLPVGAAAVPLLVAQPHRRTARIIAAVILMVFVLLGILSVGVLFLPALIAMIVAASAQDDTVALPGPRGEGRG